jgi:ABC-type lipoprotein export system ATPase subunit
MDEAIRLENVVKMYPGAKRAVNDLSLCIGEKQRVVISGALGSGKHTLMKLIAGMEAPSSGSITLLGKAVHAMDADAAARFRNKFIGVVPESPGFLERLTVLENIELPLAVQGTAPAQRRSRAIEQLKALGIPHIAHAFPSQLSVLEGQIASVARALIIKPKILLMFETGAGLSGKETERFSGTMDAVWKYGDHTALYFTASEGSAANADRHYKLDHGKIQEDIS